MCALPTVGTGNLTVSKRADGPEYDVWFIGALGHKDVPLITVDYSGLNPGQRHGQRRHGGIVRRAAGGNQFSEH